MVSADDILRLQIEQFRHDKRNHCDIANLHKGARLQHYGLHFCKYVGRLARGPEELKSYERTVIDTALVSLSAANTLAQKLGETLERKPNASAQLDPILVFADAAGRFADACEKFDHLEDVGDQARLANTDIFSWLLDIVDRRGFDLRTGISVRRKELKERAFYASE